MESIFNPFKLLNHYKEIQDMIKDNRTFPVAVEIDLTNKCNHKCVWCMFDKFKEQCPVSLDKDLLKGTLKELKECGVKAITYVGGGEPLLYKDFDEIMKYSYELGFEIGVVTNGELIDLRLNSLKKYCKFVRISLDAGNRKTHNTLHKPVMNREKMTSSFTSFYKILEGIKKLTKDKKDLIVGVGFLTHPINFGDIPELTKTLIDLKVDYLQVRPVYIKGMVFSEKLLLDINKSIEKSEEIVKGSNLHLIAIKNRFKEFNGEDLPSKKCLAHNILSIIGADGKVYLCCQLRGNKEFELGDLTKETFRDIWNGELRQKVINKIDIKRCPPCRYKTYNKIMNYLAGERRHMNFL